jgi:hypothetical protein
MRFARPESRQSTEASASQDLEAFLGALPGAGRKALADQSGLRAVSFDHGA